MSAVAVIFLCLVALALGALLGFLIAGRASAGLHAELAAAAREHEALRRDAAEHLDNFKTGVRDLALALDERNAARIEVAQLTAERDAREAAFEERIAELRMAKDALSAQFSEVGSKLLGEAQKQFLERADARFRQSEESSGVKLEALLQPVSERLKRYEEGVHKVESERRESYGVLMGQIEAMRSGQEAVRGEAAKLVNALRNAPKARGRWGEQQLRNVLETCGLSEFADFATEVSVASEDGRLRPDAIIRIPGGRSLVVDAKVSLNAYQDAAGAADDDARQLALTAHGVSMKTHIQQLGAKAYWTQFDEAPDYVIMFIPGEHFLSAALEHDSSLWDYAFDRKVLLATPTNLIAIARSVAAVWKQEALARDAQKIAELGRELYDRLVVAGNHMKSVGSGLSSAVNHYNKFVASYERNVMSSGRRFAELNVETSGRSLDELPQIDALARYGDTPLALPEGDET